MGSAQSRVAGNGAAGSGERITTASIPNGHGGSGCKHIYGNGPNTAFVPKSANRNQSDQTRNHFNFNSTQPLPWRAEQNGRMYFRPFAPCHDTELAAYLESRNLSVSFLVEIDQFLASHPEITTCAEGISMLRTMNSGTPLEAYQHFIKGYTRPARYKEGTIPEVFTIAEDFRPPSIMTRGDTELDDFFSGYVYRRDIMEEIDCKVASACSQMTAGLFVSSGMRRLVGYCAWGNPVDAFKWWEYHVQEEYLPHRYLPEHIILGQIPKPVGYEAPMPFVDEEIPRTHSLIRSRMARARDQGVDVLDVLMNEYRSALVRKRYRRKDIDRLCSRAKDHLDHVRQTRQGVDIVDMLMNDAVAREPINRPTMHHHTQTSKPAYAPSGPRITARKRVTTSHTAGNISRSQAAELIIAKRNLERAYSMEEKFMSTSRCSKQRRKEATADRARLERRYVNYVIQYLRNTKRMSTAEATGLMHQFTRKKMAGVGPVHKAYLLSLYPSELS